MKRLIITVLILLLLPFTVKVKGQAIPFDSLVFKMQAFGMLSYIIPDDFSADSITGVPLDSVYIYVVVDSIPIDSALNVSLGFDFLKITQNMWLTYSTFTDSGRVEIHTNMFWNDSMCMVDTVVDTVIAATKFYPVVIIHIIPEGAPAWIENLTGQ